MARSSVYGWYQWVFRWSISVRTFVTRVWHGAAACSIFRVVVSRSIFLLMPDRPFAAFSATLFPFVQSLLFGGICASKSFVFVFSPVSTMLITTGFFMGPTVP
jgi:hypothetical protein